MKISLNWVKKYLDFELPPIEELAERIGAQLGAIDEIVDLGAKYRGIVIVKVVDCQKIEGSDHLSLCKIDDNGTVKNVDRDENGHVQIVCGAPNVKPEQMVAWLPPGSTVPSTAETHEPFILDVREIQGHKSNGMLASPKELALGDSHDGLLELDVAYTSQRINQGEVSPVEALHNYIVEPSIKPGDDFAETYQLDDRIIDIENKMFTHRPDLFGHLGVAREIAGILGHRFKTDSLYLQPKTPASSEATADLEVRNEIPEQVPRFIAQVFDNVTVRQSPVWLQTYLQRIGIRPINNVVDITNYFMALTGQPLHAYDYDKVKQLSQADKAVIVIRNPKTGEQLKLLNGKTIEPDSQAILIATDQQPIGLGGIMGGSETEVDSSTTKIILECANFNMNSIRRTSMTHGLFTDAVTRFTKGQSPLQNDRVVVWATQQMICDTGCMPVDGIDFNNLSEDMVRRDSVHPSVKVPIGFINDRLGLTLSADEIKKILENVEFKIELNGDELTVAAPFWRTDIELREDVVEEVGRLYGYDKLPLELPKRDLTPATKDQLLELKAQIRDRLSRGGGNEVLTYSFVHGDLLHKAGQDPAQAFQVANALSPELQYYRISLMPSLLEKVHPNIKAGYDRFALFECGKTHSLDQKDKDGLPAEFEFTGLVVTANDKLKPAGAAYYQAKRYLEQLAGPDTPVYKPVSDDMRQYPVVQPYDLNRTALVSLKDGTFLGIIGEFKASVRQALKLPRFTAGFEVDTTVLQSVVATGPKYRPLSRFPSVKQDVTIKISADMTYQDLKQKVAEVLEAAVPEDSYADFEPIDIYQAEEDKSYLNVTFRVTITATNRTLTDKEVAKTLETVLTKVVV
jgi:phenylalanyl-tRNA synthetase beta chain